MGSSLFSVAAVVLLTAFALLEAWSANLLPDFFIFRAGSVLALRGESPYEPAKIRAMVAVQFPDSDRFIENCGYFLPPQAVVLFAAFAAVPFPVAKILWALVNGAAAAGVLLLLRVFAPPAPPSRVGRLVPIFLLLNFLTLGVVMVGQFSLVFVGCVAAGQWCFENRRPTLGCVLWAVAFVKPHVALPLLVLAWYLGGWRRAAGIAAMLAVLNLAGCAIAGITPWGYLEFLGGAHKAVVFNLARENYEITSWNRLLFVATEWYAGDRFLVEQSATTAVASYLIWLGLVVGRCALAGAWPSPAWAAAATGAAAVFCPQVLGYEALALLLGVPWVRELFAAGHRGRGWAAVLVLGLQAIPFQALDLVGFTFHRPLGAALFAALVLIGPVSAADASQKRR